MRTEQQVNEETESQVGPWLDSGGNVPLQGEDRGTYRLMGCFSCSGEIEPISFQRSDLRLDWTSQFVNSGAHLRNSRRTSGSFKSII